MKGEPIGFVVSFFFIYFLSIERLCIFLAGLVIREKKSTILLEVRVCVWGYG